MVWSMPRAKSLWDACKSGVLAYCPISALGGCGLVSPRFGMWSRDFGPDLMLSLTDARGIGIGGNIAVLFTGTKSQIDRSIPRGIHP